jgi:hypothetical protein
MIELTFTASWISSFSSSTLEGGAMSLARPMIVAHSVRNPGEEPVVTPPGDRGIVRRRGNGPFIHAIVLVDDGWYAPKCMLGGHK